MRCTTSSPGPCSSAPRLDCSTSGADRDVARLMLADLFADVVGVDADAGMLTEAQRRADAHGVTNATWVQRHAEAMTDDLGTFECATFGRSFHWMDRGHVARRVRIVEPGGALVHVDTVVDDPAAAAPAALRFPGPPRDAIRQLPSGATETERRAGQGVLRHGTPDDEWGAMRPPGSDRQNGCACKGARRSCAQGRRRCRCVEVELCAAPVRRSPR